MRMALSIHTTQLSVCDNESDSDGKTITDKNEANRVQKEAVGTEWKRKNDDGNEIKLSAASWYPNDVGSFALHIPFVRTF